MNFVVLNKGFLIAVGNGSLSIDYACNLGEYSFERSHAPTNFSILFPKKSYALTSEIDSHGP
mgnify:CR=1 FL=1